jgi:mannose-6-phosphate isomerase
MIPGLLGLENPTAEPWAELWMGAHPKSPSLLITESGAVPLNTFVAEDPASRLGKRAAERFGSLPFLFKILAAASPLSIQAHPAKEAARLGFERENAAGIPLDAFQRNYKDAMHKPEIMVALGDFSALLGFRSMEDIRHLAELLGVSPYRRLVSQARGDLRTFFQSLMSFPEKEKLIADICSAAGEQKGGLFEWILRLQDAYPGDIGVAAPLYMNILEMKEGEAIYLDAGKIHAYLGGLGIELMANSDNVLRGGLSSKHIDLKELCDVLDFSAFNPKIFAPVRSAEGGVIYRPPVDEFMLSRLDLPDGTGLELENTDSCEILLCTGGSLRAEGVFDLKPGDSLFVTADQRHYALEGEGTLFRAAVP